MGEKLRSTKCPGHTGKRNKKRRRRRRRNKDVKDLSVSRLIVFEVFSFRSNISLCVEKREVKIKVSVKISG